MSVWVRTHVTSHAWITADTAPETAAGHCSSCARLVWACYCGDNDSLRCDILFSLPAAASLQSKWQTCKATCNSLHCLLEIQVYGPYKHTVFEISRTWFGFLNWHDEMGAKLFGWAKWCFIAYLDDLICFMHMCSKPFIAYIYNMACDNIPLLSHNQPDDLSNQKSSFSSFSFSVLPSSPWKQLIYTQNAS